MLEIALLGVLLLCLIDLMAVFLTFLSLKVSFDFFLDLSVWQAPNPTEANSTLCGQYFHSSSHTVVGVELHSQSA